MPAGRPRKTQVEIQAVPENNLPENNLSESEEDRQSNEIEWCSLPDCFPVSHVAHEALTAAPAVDGSWEPGPTGFGKNAYFTPPEERQPSHVTLDKTI